VDGEDLYGGGKVVRLTGIIRVVMIVVGQIREIYAKAIGP
jgi:hypothetical protein